MVATEVPIVHSDGVAMFYRAVEHLSVKALQIYGANVVRF